MKKKDITKEILIKLWKISCENNENSFNFHKYINEFAESEYRTLSIPEPEFSFTKTCLNLISEPNDEKKLISRLNIAFVDDEPLYSFELIESEMLELKEMFDNKEQEKINKEQEDLKQKSKNALFEFLDRISKI